MAQNGDFVVTVLTGTHAGARLALGAGTYRIGSDPAAEIVLNEEELAPIHATLALGNDGAVVDAAAAGLRLDLQPLEASAKAGFPFELALGGVHLRVDGPRGEPGAVAPPPASRAAPARLPLRLDGRSGRAVSGAIFGLMSLAAMIYVFGGGAFGAPSPHAAAIARPPSAGLSAPAAADLGARLKRAGLAALSVEPGQGEVAVRGRLPAADRVAWQKVERAFDAKYGGRVLLRAEFATASTARPMLQPRALWAGHSPYVIDAAGNRLTVGSVTEDGWRIVRILPDRIILQRDARSVALTL